MTGALLLSGVLAAQVPEPPSPPAISWSAPSACPDADALTAAISRRLGRPLADELRLAGTITQHATSPRFRLRLDLTLEDHDSTRTLTAERCPSLVDAAALLIALQLAHSEPPPPTASDPPLADPDPPATTAPLDAPLAEPLPPPDVWQDDPQPPPISPASSAPPPPPPRPAVGALVRVHGGPEYGGVPGLSGAVGLTIGALWRRARLELHGLYIAPRTATLGANAVRVDLFAGSAHGCARLGRGALELPLCGGLELAAVRGRASGPSAQSGSGPRLAAVVTAGLVWHLRPRLGLTLALHGLAHLYGPRFELRDPGEPVALFRPSPVSARLLLGLELRLRDPR